MDVLSIILSDLQLVSKQHFTRFETSKLMSSETYLLIAYLAVGPGLWILFAFGMASSRKRMSLLKKYNRPIPEPLPLVTVIVPAKDEGKRIRQCLDSVLAQDYPLFDLLAVDDRSSDGTGDIMDEMAAADPRIKVLHIDTLPAGWTGKNNALVRAVVMARGQWLLFIDSDVVLEKAALSTSLRCAVGRRYDLLSLILKLETRGMWESALVPIASAAFGYAYLMGYSNAVGNGQFMLFNRQIYDQIGGHETVKNQFNEDMTLARIMKQSGLRPRIAWGTEFGSVRMYDSLATIMRGWSRIFFGSSSGSPWRSLTVMFFIFVVCYSAVAAATFGIYRLNEPHRMLQGCLWLAAAAIHWTLMTVELGIIYRWMGNRARYAAAFFVTGWFVLAILGRAVWMCITGKVHWRGTNYCHPIEPVKSRQNVMIRFLGER
jgi:glycosyltransferase involved in cell wall biosynthesis